MPSHPHPSTETSTRPSEAETPKRKPFERPQLRRRGTLPKVTTAFGGTFTP